ncbi:MAG: UvrB/UvrC motif-containing protein [Gemmatimonadota bacterium]|jgi:protein arginine kinase activator
MQCDHCGENEAVIHLTQIVNNEMHTFHLCEACAAQKGLQPDAATVNYPLTDFLAQMSREAAMEPGDEECGYCGLRLEDFKRTGLLGCPHCYVTFESHLRGLLRRLHGGTQHLGKVYLPPDPTEAERQQRLSGLRRKLDKAVQGEDFERAAQLRDQIRVLEGSENA